MNRPDRRFQRGAIAAALDQLQAAQAAQAAHAAHTAGTPAATVAGVSRRRFLQAGASTAAVAGLPWLASCHDNDDEAPPATRTETRTIFFNHAHLDHAGKAMSLQIGRKRYPLRPIAEMRDVLVRERAGNRFLSAVPDAQITHAVEGVEVDAEFITPACIFTATSNGQWTMESVHVMLPQASAPVAYARASARAGAAALPASLKRQKYKALPAASAQDLHEEQALLDTASHSATLIAAHKNLLGLDGNAASTVINVHVMNSNAVFDLDDKLGSLGTAAPETAPGVVSPTGWATLRPVVNKLTNQPFTMSADGRNCYMPVLHPDVALLVGQGVGEVLPQAQNDQTLGADITARPDGSSLRGVLWTRQDGKPTVIQGTTPAPLSQAPAMAVNWVQGTNYMLDVSATVTPLGGGVQQLDFSYTNTGLRYLSAYIEFEDEAGSLITLDQMPGWTDGTWVTAPPNFSETYSPGEDAKKTRINIGGIACIGTVMGIPVFTNPTFYGSLSATMKIPSSVHKVRLFAGGLGSGSNNYPDTIAGGVAGTMLMNYCVTSIFAVLGAIPDVDAAFSLVSTIVSTFLSDLASGLLDKFSGNDIFSPQFWTDQGLNMINLVVGMFGAYGVEPTIKAFATGIASLLGTAVAEEGIKDAVWFVGLALNIESAVAGLLDLEGTSLEVAQSPFTYVTELVFTHDVTVTINADTSNDTTFPKSANVFQVVAKFDDGKPWKSGWLPVPVESTQTTHTFSGVPYGGSVQFEAVFAQRALDGSDADNILLGRGSTDKVANDDATAYALTIVEQEFPVGTSTIYRHQQRTYLNGSNQHVWVQEAAPNRLPATFPCGSAGQVCSFNGIAVRQGNLGHPSMLAYAWRGQNAAGGGEVEQAALVNADFPALAYAVNTLQLGGGGLTLAVSRDSGGANNYYVDASGASPMIRAINFPDSGQPTLDGPASNRAFGMLNFASSALLVHPSGALVSVSGPNQRLEILNPPDAPVSDAEARDKHIAQTLGYTGERVGCMNSVIAATITNDGTLLVLEGGANNRIQAFDLGANAVRYFSNAPVPYFLPLTGLERSKGWVHIDVQADHTGLLFLLSVNQSTGVYQLSIYDSLSKLQSPLSVTPPPLSPTAVPQIYAARIGLDHWRNLYTLNYQPITVQGSGAAPAITEPSVSLWTPCNRGVTC